MSNSSFIRVCLTLTNGIFDHKIVFLYHQYIYEPINICGILKVYHRTRKRYNVYAEIIRHRIGSLLERDYLALLLSLMIQIPLAFFLGHFYDIRIAMGTGYLVAG